MSLRRGFQPQTSILFHCLTLTPNRRNGTQWISKFKFRVAEAGQEEKGEEKNLCLMFLKCIYTTE